MATITFLPAGVTIEVRDGTTVFSAAARAEVAIASQCGGNCACALCRVKVVGGDAHISPMKWEEEGHLGNCYHLCPERLSCQLQVFGDVTVEVPEDDGSEKKKSRYIPYSLIRKREKMEREEELRRVRGAAGRGGSAIRASRERTGAAGGGLREDGAESDSHPGGPSHEADSRQKRKSRRSSRGGRGRKRTTGALRPGDTRPPSGARKKDREGSSG